MAQPAKNFAPKDANSSNYTNNRLYNHASRTGV